MVVIIDYDIGNIHSIAQVLEHLGVNYIVSRKHEDVQFADKLILPGVGAFGAAMAKLIEYGLHDDIKVAVEKGCSLLGICLGMQLLATSSCEGGHNEGLGLIKGEILFFKQSIKKVKIPHVGFNSVNNNSGIDILPNKVDTDFYFTHSYIFSPLEKCKTATTNYEIDFISAIQKDSIYGVQFHPEKSQSNGISLFEKFVEAC